MKVSIITIVRNAESAIVATVESVLAQDYPDIEYIVIDGASTDGTLQRLDPFHTRIAHLVCEPDRGISDAWNKGLKLVTGEVVGLINAGDAYASDAVSKAVAAIQAGADVVYGDTELVDGEGRLLLHNRGRFHLWWYSSGLGFYHPSLLARRSVYEKVGGFDTRLRYAMDTDWIVRAALSGARFRRCGVRTRMLDGGVSVKNRFVAYGEHLQALDAAGAGEPTVYRSMVMTGLRGLVRHWLRGPRQ